MPKTRDLAREFPMASKVRYLNTAGVGLIPRSTLEAMSAEYSRYLSTPPYEDLFGEWAEMVEEARGKFGGVIGASGEEVSFQQNASMGIILTVEMLNPRRGDNVVIDDLGFPSDTYPLLALKRRGVEVRMVKNRRGLITAQDYEGVVDGRTKLVMLSYVSWVNGLRSEVEEISKVARESGAMTMVDSTHGTGYLDIDVKRWKVDFLTTSNYKWLLSPFGAAEFYCAKEHLEEFESPHIGWNSNATGPGGLKVDAYDLYRTAKRFEPGNPDYVSIYGLTRSLELMRSIGIGSIRDRTLRLVKRVLEGAKELRMGLLTPTDDRHISGAVFAYSKERDGQKLASGLAKRRVLVSARQYRGVSGIRISPYFYNSDEDVERLIEGLRETLRE